MIANDVIPVAVQIDSQIGISVGLPLPFPASFLRGWTASPLKKLSPPLSNNRSMERPVLRGSTQAAPRQLCLVARRRKGSALLVVRLAAQLLLRHRVLPSGRQRDRGLLAQLRALA